MTHLQGKRILLGITGSIAAYKAAFLTRLLIKAGAEVKVLMTPAATRFVTPLTLSTLSKNEVLTGVSSEKSWHNHVELGLWADVMLLAPATANTMAKIAAGLCDNIIEACYLSARCPVFFAPAMDVDMWKHPATQGNIRKLLSYGNRLIPVSHGELASGLVGEGRMAEPEDIVRQLTAFLSRKADLKDKHVMITAGPTYEPIDPVRFVGNRSSGRMGIALAEAAAQRGAEVRLILGPTHLSTSVAGIAVQRVRSAREMLQAAEAFFPKADVAILAAAVADYRPREIASEKIKKQSSDIQLEMVKNPDIAARLGKQKKPEQQLIGFALETENEKVNARAKLDKKNFDFIVLNSLRDEGAGFDISTNKVTIIHRDNKVINFELKSKSAVAEDILDEVVELFTSNASA